MKSKSLKPEGQMLRGVVYRLIESLASMGHISIWKLIFCAISVFNTLTVGVHLSSTPIISGPGSATAIHCGTMISNFKIHLIQEHNSVHAEQLNQIRPILNVTCANNA